MSYNEIFSSKNPVDAAPYSFEFGDQLLFGETITGATVVASVFSGEDPTPSNIISGTPTISGTTISQLIIDGVDGVVYTLVAVVNTSLSHVYSKSATLAIVDQATAY